MSVPEDVFWKAPIPRRERWALTAFTLLAFTTLLLARLGHPALWDDEANTALFGQSLWATGETNAVIGDNIVAYRNGAELNDQLVNRHLPPLQYFLEAPFVRDTHSAWWARLPFALAGLGTLLVLARWLSRLDASRQTWVLSCLAVLGNISLVLYSKQARYYGPTLLFATGLAYAYAQRERGRGALVWMGVTAIGLLATQYLCYAAMAMAIAVDYLVWGRKTARVPWRWIITLGGIQLAAAAMVVSIWTPAPQVRSPEVHGWVVDHLVLWLAELRELNSSEFGVGLLMLAAPLLSLRTRDPLLRRLPVAILVATATVAVFSPQPVDSMFVDIRYCCFLIPACIVLSVRSIEALPLRPSLRILVGLTAFQTTFMHWVFAQAFEPKYYSMPLRSTLVSYLGELLDPPPSAYLAAASYLREHAHRGETAITVPVYGIYPMMFYEPDLVYGWQFTMRKAAEMPDLAPIHAAGAIAPDWIVVFGGNELKDLRMSKVLDHLGARYEQATEIPITGTDASRPEVFLHQFRSDEAYVTGHPLSIWHRTK